MKKSELQIELLLPGLVDSRDDCITRLNGLIESRKGVEKAHLRESTGESSNAICVHFDPSVISIGEIRRFAIQAGADLGDRYGHMLLRTSSMDARGARKIKEQVEKFKGVLDVGVSADGVIRIEYAKVMTSAEEIRTRIDELRIVVKQNLSPPTKLVPDEDHAGHDHAIEKSADDSHSGHDHGKSGGRHDHRHGGIFGERSELIFAIICGVLLLTGWLISFSSANPWIPWAFYAAAYFFGGYYIVREAIEKILLKRFEIDFLMIVAAIGAAILGAWAEGALLLFLFAIGHALENYAMGRARKAIEALADLAPERAIVRRDGATSEVSVEQLVVGDIVIVKTNERIAADGFVVKGQSSVNQAPITGESVPVEKQPVDDPDSAAKNPEKLPPENRVFAGTINESGSLEIQVTQLASESTLARVVTMVSEAETQQSPTQQFTDKFERYFVPAVIVGVVLLLFAFLVIDEPFSASFYRAMAVLVAASPCALAIATPSAVLSGVARAARGGVLVKGGGPLENLGRLSAIAFDKTGTLTEGKPSSYRHCERLKMLRKNNFLRNSAIAVEKLSDHPLAAAVVRDGTEKTYGIRVSFLKLSDLQSITGRGIKATVEGETVLHWQRRFVFAKVEGHIHFPMIAPNYAVRRFGEDQGRTMMIVRRGDKYLGAIVGLMDTPREAAKAMIAELRELGIEQMIMISGDNQQVADAVAKEVGIDDAWGDLMPDDKVASIKKLRVKTRRGDGWRWSQRRPSHGQCHGRHRDGSRRFRRCALETADVALMADELSHLPFAVGLSRQTSRIIRQNLWYSLGMVAILVPATIFGLNIGLAVLLHEGSTLVVVFNALRLLVYKK